MQEESQIAKLLKYKYLPFILLAVCFIGCASNSATASKAPSLDEVIKQAAGKIEEHLDKGTKVALINVQSPTSQFSEYVLTYLESILVNNGKLIVVDRANLDKIRQEQGFQLSGEVSDESAKTIGKLLGAGAIVTGTLINIGDSYRLTLKAINVETATVAASYPADIAKNERVRALLASGNTTSSAGTPIITIVNNTGSAINKTGLFPTGSKDYDSYLRILDENIDDKTSRKFSLPPTDSTKKYSIMLLTTNGSTFIKENLSIKPDMTVTFNQSDKVSLPAKTTAAPAAASYKIGDTGPAGGIIFFDKGNTRDGWRYLEAAPANTEKTCIMSGGIMVSSKEQRVGFGKENTKSIMKYFEENGGEVNTSAWICDNLVLNGFDDWYLPSSDELMYIYSNLYSNGFGNFKRDKYWSSTNWGLWAYHFIDFAKGEKGNDTSSYKHLVRAVRRF